MVSLSRIWRLKYYQLVEWIRADESRQERFDRAVSDRREWAMEAVLGELQRLALGDSRELFDDDGRLKPPGEWSETAASMVASVSRNGKGAVTKVTMINRLRALEMLGKHLNMFAERHEHEHSGRITLEDVLCASRQEG